MIYFVTRIDSTSAIQRLQTGVRSEFPEIKLLTYEELFHTQRAPLGHYVFTDQDRLSTYEVEVVRSLAVTLQNADPNIRILNFPGQVLERFPLLRALEQTGKNQFSVTRLDDGVRPERYPVFIRCEDHHEGADTELLDSEDELEQALGALQQQGKVLKRRVAVEFCAEQSPDGRYRKYGVINIDGTIIPQHIIESEHWLAKANGGKRIYDEAVIQDELEFVTTNPHRDELKEVFELARIDYGRADYGIVNGRLQIYEINTNPHLPRLHEELQTDKLTAKGRELRSQRRQIIRGALIDALSEFNVPMQACGSLSFPLPKWRHHELSSLSPLNVRVRRFRENCFYTLQSWKQRHPTASRWIPAHNVIRKLCGR